MGFGLKKILMIVFMCGKRVRMRGQGVVWSFLSAWSCPNGNFRRIQGISERGLPQVQPVEKHRQQYLQPNRYGHKNGSGICTNRSALTSKGLRFLPVSVGCCSSCNSSNNKNSLMVPYLG